MSVAAGRRSGAHLRRPALLTSIALGLIAGVTVLADWWMVLPEDAAARYVGSDSCRQCHATEFDKWKGSHHDLAMARATTESVLGDFNDCEFTHFDVVSRMYRDGDRFMIRTEGPDGKLGDFEVKYVFGVAPLQQYMVEFDRLPDQPAEELGRLQVLRISWDTERKRWFYLPPPDVDEKLAPDDDLHWTGVAQRWNTMCADCHSTNLQKGFDAQTGHYHTTFSEINVSCEACHGPGSLHVDLARSRSLFWDRKRGYGLARLKEPGSLTQIHACAPCHSRRRVVHPDFQAGANYYDYFANELLNPLAYHADGQILDEVYEYGSFIQSKMYHKGIRCTDCHDPHTARLKHQGNQLCTSCHAHAPGKYDSPSHHHHQPGSRGSQCVECHMPESTYMEIDARRDHSLRVPRPDLSLKLGTPNACTRCHLQQQPGLDGDPGESIRAMLAHDVAVPRPPDEMMEYQRLVQQAATETAARERLRRIDQWATDRITAWYGRKPLPLHFGELLREIRQRGPEARGSLERLLADPSFPAIARATAISELETRSPTSLENLFTRLRQDPDPQVRSVLPGLLEALPTEDLRRLGLPFLNDSSRLVRTEAARVLASVPWQLLRADEREKWQLAADEYQLGLMATNDRAAAYLPLGVMFEQAQKPREAQQAYETALRIEPRATGPRSNLALLLETEVQQQEQALQRNAGGDSARIERELTRIAPLRSRVTQLRAEELELLGRDARLAPRSAAVQYRYGLSLYLNGRTDEAEVALLAAYRLEPAVPDFQLALALLYQKLGRRSSALEFARRLVEQDPRNASYQQLLQELQAMP